jgi:hypothetical protein
MEVRCSGADERLGRIYRLRRDDRFEQVEELMLDGDGRAAKRLRRNRIWAYPANGWSEAAEYHLISSVTGRTITELDETGGFMKTNVYMGSTLIAEKNASELVFKTTDPVTGGTMQQEASGEITPNGVGRVESEPLGTMIPTTEPENEPHDYEKGAFVGNPETLFLDGAPISGTRLMRIMRSIGATGPGGYIFGNVWHYRKYLLNPGESPRSTDDDDNLDEDDIHTVEDDTHLVAEWYEYQTATYDIQSFEPQTIDGPRYLKEHDVIGSNWYPKITNILFDIFGDPGCVEAFEAVGIDLAKIWNKGFYIGSSTLITDSGITDAQVKLPSHVRAAYRSRLKNQGYFSKILASTITLEGNDDIPRIFITHNALAPGLFSSVESKLKDVLIHELIHVGGKPGQDPGWWKFLGYDDLSYMQKEYQNILDQCR